MYVCMYVYIYIYYVYIMYMPICQLLHGNFPKMVVPPYHVYFYMYFPSYQPSILVYTPIYGSLQRFFEHF